MKTMWRDHAEDGFSEKLWARNFATPSTLVFWNTYVNLKIMADGYYFFEHMNRDLQRKSKFTFPNFKGKAKQYVHNVLCHSYGPLQSLYFLNEAASTDQK